jgi:hypothetical protein
LDERLCTSIVRIILHPSKGALIVSHTRGGTIGERQCRCVACCRYFLATYSSLFYDKRVPAELRMCVVPAWPQGWASVLRRGCAGSIPTYRAVIVQDETSGTFTLAVRSAGLDTVRLVLSFAKAALTETYTVLVTNRADWDA